MLSKTMTKNWGTAKLNGFTLYLISVQIASEMKLRKLANVCKGSRYSKVDDAIHDDFLPRFVKERVRSPMRSHQSLQIPEGTDVKLPNRHWNGLVLILMIFALYMV